MPIAPLVGIFFQVDGSLPVDAVATIDAEQYGQAVQHGGHYDYWAALQPETVTNGASKRATTTSTPAAAWCTSPTAACTGSTSTGA